MTTLSREDVAHVAYLARLGLTEDELTRLHGQLDHILQQYTVLTELDTDDIPPTAQTIEVETILRDDVARPSLSVDEALAGAPERVGDHLVVPTILTERPPDRAAAVAATADPRTASGADPRAAAPTPTDHTPAG